MWGIYRQGTRARRYWDGFRFMPDVARAERYGTEEEARSQGKLWVEGRFLVADLPELDPYPGCQRYDVLQIDWRKGEGWQDYTTLRDLSEFREAARIVKGGTCASMPHWIPRSAVSFRIKSDRGDVKLSE
jgi:hypothetical protein